jgi:hypothetical protein
MPTFLILVVGLLIMIFVIPYAFSSVIKQLEAEQLMEAAKEKKKEKLRLEFIYNQTMLANATTMSPDDTTMQSLLMS